MAVNRPIIQLSSLSKFYFLGKTTIEALKDINLQVDAGEFVVITGPSGSGKTTLLNMIGLLDMPSRGFLQVDGKDVSQFRRNEVADFRRHQIGFIFQLYRLLPGLTVLENVILPVLPYRQELEIPAEKKAGELLCSVGLEGCVTKFPAELSGGEQQRVALARALIYSPKIILADEPTGNLDKETGRGIIDLLIDQNKNSGTTILLVTHTPDLVKMKFRKLSIINGKLFDKGNV